MTLSEIWCGDCAAEAVAEGSCEEHMATQTDALYAELDAIYANAENKPEMLRLLADFGNTEQVVKWARAKQAQETERMLDATTKFISPEYLEARRGR